MNVTATMCRYCSKHKKYLETMKRPTAADNHRDETIEYLGGIGVIEK